VNYAWNFSSLSSYVPLWWRGLQTTCLLSLAAIIAGSVLAVMILAARRSPYRLVNRSARLYIDIFRALPVFVLLSLIFFVVPIITGVRLSAWQSALWAFALNLAPFVTECIRAGFDSVPLVQFESGKVLGLSHRQIFRYIIAPQAAQRIIPSLLGEYITTIKLTSLASVIGVEEIWNVGGQIVSRTSLTIEARLVSSLLYVAIILPLIWWLKRLEKRLGTRGLVAGLNPA
jgi:polar amino acid transport system permease protein